MLNIIVTPNLKKLQNQAQCLYLSSIYQNENTTTYHLSKLILLNEIRL